MEDVIQAYSKKLDAAKPAKLPKSVQVQGAGRIQKVKIPALSRKNPRDKDGAPNPSRTDAFAIGCNMNHSHEPSSAPFDF